LHIVFIGNCQVVGLSTIYQTFVVPHIGDEVQCLGCNATSADNFARSGMGALPRRRMSAKERRTRCRRAPLPRRSSAAVISRASAGALASWRKFDEAIAAIEIAEEMEPGNAEFRRSRDACKRGAGAALVSA